jgi:hypothetical protein
MAQYPAQTTTTTNILDILDKILDKGLVIAGDIKISLADVELLTIKIRLIVASVDKAKEIGLNWWETDPSLSTQARLLEDEKRRLTERIQYLEGVIEEKTVQT